MGLIKAGLGALGGTLADQWKEYFICDSMESTTLVTRGKKQTSGRSSNTKGHDNVISNGSAISVADGQCMMIVEGGKVLEVCAEPGVFVFDSSTEPSIFTGSLGQAIMDTFKTVGKRFTYGGDVGNDQRVYYFNTKELVDNKFGTPTPVPFRVVDARIGLDIDVSIRCSGIYSYKIVNPLLFYANVCGNVTEDYTRDLLDQQLKTEFISALAPAFARLSDLGLRPNRIAAHATEMEQAMNAALSAKWAELRGIEVVSVALNPITLTDEDAELIKQAQRAAMLRDPGLAAGTLVGAQADAMKTAAGNSAGAITGFMGMNMAGQNGAGTAQGLYQMAKDSAPSETPASKADAWKCPKCGVEASGKFCSECGEKKPIPPQKDAWHCSCGATVSGKFCPECGAKKPEDGWVCACGTVNKGKFCSECGAKKPADAPLYRCDKCGFEPEDPKNPPKFCPECGDRFDEDDIR